MNLNQVTITGADNSIRPEQLIPLFEKYSFLECGILLSQSSEGRYRFPSLDWMESLYEKTCWPKTKLPKYNFSGHLCGKWVRDICEGNWTFLEDRPTIAKMFRRIQLNFHAEIHKIDRTPFVKGLKEAQTEYGYQFLFQLDDVNNNILDVALEAGIDACPFYDRSGGIGVLPDQWPAPRPPYCGYAGGLSPDNLEDQLGKISAAVGDSTVPIWIDVETRVRSENNAVLDLEKTERFLEISSKYVSA